jgi:hypothetical protein
MRRVASGVIWHLAWMMQQFVMWSRLFDNCVP